MSDSLLLLLSKELEGSTLLQCYSFPAAKQMKSVLSSVFFRRKERKICDLLLEKEKRV